MKLKYRHIAWGAIALLMTSCYEDKGNYTYSEVETIEITLPEKISAMAFAENIAFTPKVVSSVAGEISSDNENYEFGCKISYQHRNENNEQQFWMDLNPEKKKDIDSDASIPAGNYTLWYTVTNKETGVTTNAKGAVSVISTTSEGWMVLNNVGADKQVRLDMIFKSSKGEMMTATDVMGPESPKLHGGRSVVMHPSLYSGKELIYLLTDEGGYRLDPEKLTTKEANNMKMNDFILSSTPGEPASMLLLNYSNAYGPTTVVCVTDEGNAYAILSNSAGAAFEDPLNTDKKGSAPTYKLSTHMGTSLYRSSGGNSSTAIFYDVTNKRFLCWDYYQADKNMIAAIPDEYAKKYPWKTGMDMVDMVSTRFSSGMIYTILVDDQQQRHIYPLNMANDQFIQSEPYSGITAEHFNDAQKYAFHSQFPFMYYSYENKVYAYNLGTATLMKVIELPAGEKVSMLKFNIYAQPAISWFPDRSDEFLGKQYDLIVGSTTGAEDGGVVRFYDIEADGSMEQLSEYTGFGEVVDVTYRERR